MRHNLKTDFKNYEVLFKKQKQENMLHTRKKMKSVEIVPKEPQMLDLQDFKSTVLDTPKN